MCESALVLHKGQEKTGIVYELSVTYIEREFENEGENLIEILFICKTWVCGRSPAGIAGSNPTGGMDVYLLCVVCCQVDVSATS